MKVVVSVDSFKGSLTSLEAGNAIRIGILNCMDVDVCVLPLSDGGEGFMEGYMSHQKGVEHRVNVKDAMGKDVEASYFIVEESQTAIIEMARMCGIDRIQKEHQDILHASTFGLGQIILHALNEGCKSFVIGIGGSGTNDGGSGMLMALGYQLLDKKGQAIQPGAIGLSTFDHMSFDMVDKRLNDSSFVIACDVKNPLVGINGCSEVFGPQKGANEAMVKDMDEWMCHYAQVINKYYSCDYNQQGSGAAGGLGFAFLSLLGAHLQSGIDLILNSQNIEEIIQDSDIVITGEGCLDAQTVMGKAPSGIAKLAKKYNKPVIAFAGKLSSDADLCNSHGIDAFFSIQSKPSSLEEAMDKSNALENLKSVAQQVFRLIKLEI